MKQFKNSIYEIVEDFEKIAEMKSKISEII